MTHSDPPPAQSPPIIQPISFGDVRVALVEGLSDFRRAPAFGLFFSAFYVPGGFIVLARLMVLEQS